MEREVRHPLLFTICGFVLCFMFAGNLARAEPPEDMTFDKNISSTSASAVVMVNPNSEKSRSVATTN